MVAANEQPAARSGRSTRFVGERIAAVSAMKWTPQNTIKSAFGRLAIWRDALTIFRDFPITGTGLNTFGAATLVYQTANRNMHFQEAHNEYLQLLAEGGLLLAIPIVMAIAALVRGIVRRFQSSDDPEVYWLRVGAVGGLVAIALQSLVEFSLQMPGNAALFVVLLAIALHTSRKVHTTAR